MPKQTAQSVSKGIYEPEIRSGKKLPVKTVFNLIEIPVNGPPVDRPLMNDENVNLGEEVEINLYTFKSGKLIKQPYEATFRITANDSIQSIIHQ
jgi:hypothetical protein